MRVDRVTMNGAGTVARAWQVAAYFCNTELGLDDYLLEASGQENIRRLGAILAQKEVDYRVAEAACASWELAKVERERRGIVRKLNKLRRLRGAESKPVYAHLRKSGDFRKDDELKIWYEQKWARAIARFVDSTNVYFDTVFHGGHINGFVAIQSPFVLLRKDFIFLRNNPISMKCIR